MFQTNTEIINSLPAVVFPTPQKSVRFERKKLLIKKTVLIKDSRYTVRLAENDDEIKELLKLRHRVFKVEMGKESEGFEEIETDEFDLSSHHLIAVENRSGKIIGGYRLRTAETNSRELGFYSASEFQINDLPPEILEQSVEIGRACIDAEFRNGKVLLLLWRGLAQYLLQTGKRYFFGCCSLFSTDPTDAKKAFQQLRREGLIHKNFKISPLNSIFSFTETIDPENCETIELPKLFNTYLRIGAKVCSQPIIDEEFGTIDFFVIFDSLQMNEKYRKLFFD